MFDNYKEIIWLINLMNLNDKRPLISINDIFDNNGFFIVDENTGEEIGKEIYKKITGYVSYVKGGDIETFYENISNSFDPEHSVMRSSI